MKLKISNLRFSKQKTEPEFYKVVSRLSGFPTHEIDTISILKISQDNRKKNAVIYCYTIEVIMKGSASIDLPTLKKKNPKYHFEDTTHIADNILETISKMKLKTKPQIYIIGAGPAGLFAAYILAHTDCRVTIIERGKNVEQRDNDILNVCNDGNLNPDSNICFGEGGAGTYSDGKLYTRKNSPHNKLILETLTAMGAPREIISAGRPHIGTDKLHIVLNNFRKELVSKGVQFKFDEQLTDFESHNNSIQSLSTTKDEYTSPDAVILAIGHSAGDTYTMLYDHGLAMESKPFALGVRCEHPQEFINRAQYGKNYDPDLPAANYRLAHNISNDRSAYSFCMCPGGQVVCSSSEKGRLVINGMSHYKRNSEYANAALVVKVNTTDFSDGHPLAGLRFREQWEREAFNAGGGNYHAPAQRIADFITDKASTDLPESSYKPGLTPYDLNRILPDFVRESLNISLHEFNKKIPGFVSNEAILIGSETRTSSPVRILRGKDGSSVNADNLYPTGEGAGYAGVLFPPHWTAFTPQ